MHDSITVREDIKARMLNNINFLWGNKKAEITDPLIKAFVDILTIELFKVPMEEAHALEKKLIQKISMLFKPDMLAVPLCAHAIACARPNTSIETISTKTQFVCTKKKNKEYDTQNIFFTPLSPARLCDISIKYFITGTTAWYVNESNVKTSLLKACQGCGQNNVLWLGLKMNPAIKNINNIPFYFDLENTFSDNDILDYIQRSNWYLNNKQIVTTNGFVPDFKTTQTNKKSNTEKVQRIEQDVHNVYNKHFVTITDSSLENSPSSGILEEYPKEFQQQFSNIELKIFQEPLLWIKIVTPVTLKESVLTDLQVHINAFPVLNRQYVEYTHGVKNISNTIPLHTNLFEYFLSIVSVEDSQGNVFRKIPGTTYLNPEQRMYALRKAYSEFMDIRTAKEHLLHLLEIMRDETASFAEYGHDYVNILKEMERLLVQLDQRIRKSSQCQPEYSHFVVVDHSETEDTFFVKYWVTNSVHANGIQAGTKLNQYKGQEIKNGSLYLLTTTIGGKPVLESETHIESYKCDLLTHNKIITADDIKACCVHELGNKIKSNINIRKGLISANAPNHGGMRCVEILLKKNTHYISGKGEIIDWNYELKKLQEKIEDRSSLNLNIKLHLI
jgi:hypothetical protein